MKRREYLASASLLVPGGGFRRSTSSPYDVFLIAGQSNAKGRGDAARSPTVDRGVAWEWNGDQLVHLSDPVGTANTGSAWPAFAREYHARTGRKATYVPAAVGGTPQQAEAVDTDRHWDVGGRLLPKAVESYRAAVQHHQSRGDRPRLAGVLWHQGERDAGALEHGIAGVSVENYREAFLEMVSRVRGAVGEDNLPFYTFQIAHRASGDTDGYRAIRGAQVELAEENSGVHLVFDQAKTFIERGLMDDMVHYSQEGYNEMGREGARRVVEVMA